MPIITKSIVQVCYGLQANLPSTAAGIAAALSASLGVTITAAQINPGVIFFCTDSGNFYAWSGSEMVQINSAGFANPMDASGDMIYENLSGSPARLPIGTSGEVLTVVGGIPTWAATAQSTNFEANGTTLSSDSTINFEGDGTYIGASNPSAGNVKFALNYSTLVSALESSLDATFDPYGAAASALSTAESFATSAAATAQSNAETYANSVNTSGTAAGLSGTPSISITNLTVGGTTSFAAGAIAIAALAHDTIGLTDSTGLFTISGSPASLGGGLTLSAFASQSQSVFLGGPASGSGAAAFRALALTDLPSGYNAWSNESNASANLTLSNAGYTTTFNQTSAVAWLWANTTSGTGSTTNASPVLELGANYYTGSASAQDLWTLQTSLGSGTNGASTLTIGHSGTSGNGTVFINAPNTGGLYPTLQLAQTSGYSSYTTGIGSYYGYMTVHGAGAYHVYNGTTVGLMGAWTATPQEWSIGSRAAGSHLLASGYLTTQTAYPAIILNNGAAANNSMTATSGTQICAAVAPGAAGLVTFAPTSGTANFVALQVNPTINQTGSASGSYTALQINAVETALLGSSNYLINAMAGSAGTTSMFSVTNKGVMQLAAASAAPTSAGTAGTAGQILYYGGLLYFCSVTGAAGSATWNKLNMTAV
jgi:hypothetical protein